MKYEIRPRSCIIEIKRIQRRTIHLNIKKRCAPRYQPAIVLRTRSRAIPHVSLVNSRTTWLRTRRRVRQLSARSLRLRAERSTALARLNERPRLVPVIPVRTFNLQRFLRIMWEYVERNEVVLPDHDMVRERVQGVLNRRR